MIQATNVPLVAIAWSGAVRIVRSIFPPIDLFEDIADPADWALLIAGEQKTNPRLMESIGNLDLVPLRRRVSGSGASFLMAPFTHVSADRQSRYGDGSYGVLYAGDRFEVALFETFHHHENFMARTREKAGWTSQFRELILDVTADLHDVRGEKYQELRDPVDYHQSQMLAATLREAGSNGVVYPSIRCPGGQCVGLFYPDLPKDLMQGRHLDYHWNGHRVDLYRDASTGDVFRVVEGG